MIKTMIDRLPRTNIYKHYTTCHPGQILHEYVSLRFESQRKAAKAIGITSKQLSLILNGKASITAKTAILLEKVFKRPAKFWMQLQVNYDLYIAEERLNNEE